MDRPGRCVGMSSFSLMITVMAVTVVTLPVEPGSAELITYWNFNAYDGNGHTVSADYGSGLLQIDPAWGSSDLENYTGTIKNAQFGDPGGTSLSLVGEANNGRWIDWYVDTTGYETIIMRYVTRTTSTGFHDNAISWSIDGGTSFIEYQTEDGGDALWPMKSFNLSAYTELNNRPEVIFRFTMSDASSASGNTRLDNMTFHGSLIPSPPVFALLGLAGVSLRSRRGSRSLVPVARVRRRCLADRS